MEPLLSESEQKKRPIILYIIIGILLITIIVLSILLGIKSGSEKKIPKKQEEEEKEKEEQPFNPINETHSIEVKESFYDDDKEYGAYSYHGCGNNLNSEYFKILDVYNMKPNANRSILTNFKTYQQTSEYTSPCSLIIMILT